MESEEGGVVETKRVAGGYGGELGAGSACGKKAY